MTRAAKATADPVALACDDLSELHRGWDLSLRARNKSPMTIKSYMETLHLFQAFLLDAGMPTAVDRINREHVEMFIADQLARWRPKTAQVRYGNLRQFFNWAVEERQISTHPMVNMKPPTVPEVPVPVVGDDVLRKLLKVCDGSTFENRRDTAILRVLIDCGLRLAEVTNLVSDYVDFDLQVVIVTGKGSRQRSVPFGAKTAQGLDRYMRSRRRHPYANLQALWLGPKGPLTKSGIAQMLRRRCRDASVPQLHPHQLRHTAAHAWLAAGGNEGDAMRLFGWRSRQMLNRYGAYAADERAQDAARRLAVGDRL